MEGKWKRGEAIRIPGAGELGWQHELCLCVLFAQEPGGPGSVTAELHSSTNTEVLEEMR